MVDIYEWMIGKQANQTSLLLITVWADYNKQLISTDQYRFF